MSKYKTGYRDYNEYERICPTCNNIFVVYNTTNHGPKECVNCSRDEQYEDAFDSLWFGAIRLYEDFIWKKDFNRKKFLNRLDKMSNDYANGTRTCVKDSGDNIIPVNFKHVMEWTEDKVFSGDHIAGNKQLNKVFILELIEFFTVNNINPSELRTKDNIYYILKFEEFKVFLQSYGKICVVTKKMNDGPLKNLQKIISTDLVNRYLNVVGPIYNEEEDDFYSMEISIEMIKKYFLSLDFAKLVERIKNNSQKNKGILSGKENTEKSSKKHSTKEVKFI